MAGICVCTTRLFPKNFRTVSISYLSRITNKNKAQCIRHYAASSQSSTLYPTTSVSKYKNSSLLLVCNKYPEFCYLHTSYRLNDELREIKVPQLAESLSEGDMRWDKAVGDQVKEDEVIGEIETDKTSVPVHSPSAGVIEELLVEDGATVQPGQSICKLRVGGSGGAESSKKEASTASPPESMKEPTSNVPTQKESPSADHAEFETKEATKDSRDPPQAPSMPSQPKSSKSVSTIKIPVEQQPLSPEKAQSMITGSRTEQRVKMNRMRQRIAQRLKEAQNTYAMLTTFNEIDMSNIIDMRNKHKDAFFKKHGIKLGFMSAFVKASAYALQDQPVCNAVIDENEIVYRDFIDISVAVATPKGLVVPVIRGLGNMNFADIEKSIHALGEKARTNSLAIEDMDGGTFTISNGGVFGSLFGTPIINPPQSSILGMHAIVERPVAVNSKVEIKPMMFVALTYDHRLIDGREAVLFLRKIKAAIEDPRIMFLDL